MIKKRYIILLFILSFVFFAILLFPYKEFFKKNLLKLTKTGQISLSWEKSSFNFWKFSLEKARINISNETILADKLFIYPGLGRIKFVLMQDKNKSSGVISPKEIKYDIKNLSLPESLKKNFGEGFITTRGTYSLKNNKGEGVFQLDLKSVNIPLIKDSIFLSGKYQMTSTDLNAEFSVQGLDLGGRGEAKIQFGAAPDNSLIEGFVDLKVKDIPGKLSFSGSLNNISWTIGK